MTKTVSLFRIFFVALMMCATTLLGQSVNEITVTGKVIDDKGETVIGASILVKGTGTGVITDIDAPIIQFSPLSSITFPVTVISLTDCPNNVVAHIINATKNILNKLTVLVILFSFKLNIYENSMHYFAVSRIQRTVQPSF